MIAIAITIIIAINNAINVIIIAMNNAINVIIIAMKFFIVIP